MPRSDDSNGFPQGRRRRAHPTQAASEWDSGERAGRDWRYPDPVERYSQDYDEYTPGSPREPYADEWQTAPERPTRDDGFAAPRGREPAAPSWPETDFQDDPFDWDAPEPPAETGWQADAHDEGPADFGRETFDSSESWGGSPPRFETPRQPDPAPQRPAMRDDSLFRRIDGSGQVRDLSALTGAGRVPAPDDPFSSGGGRDPSELRDRFFSGADPLDDPYAEQPTQPAPSGNIFDFDAHRGSARQPQDDDPYSWDSYDDEPPMAAPQAAAPAAAGVYADDYGAYDDPYADDPHLDAEDDLDADFLDDEAEPLEDPVAPPKSLRKLMVAGVLVAAVATGGAAAFVYKSFQDGSLANMDAPTLLADDGPVKSKPSDPGGKEFPDGNKQIYDRLSGQPAKPVEDAAVSDADTGTAAIPGIVTTGAEAPADTLDERIAAALRKSGRPAGDATADETAYVDSPRPVRTLTVRPDGSVVPAPVETVTQSGPDDTQTVTTAGIVSATETGTSERASREEAAPQEPRTRETTEAAAPAPAPRPEPQPRETRVASAAPTASDTPQTSTASANPYFVQLAARRDQTSALAAFADLQQKYPDILNGLAPTIKKADLGDKGVWYRLWVGPMGTRGNAQDVCGKLKQAGLGGCFVRTE